jgi:hypothetical protein
MIIGPHAFGEVGLPTVDGHEEDVAVARVDADSRVRIQSGRVTIVGGDVHALPD